MLCEKYLGSKKNEFLEINNKTVLEIHNETNLMLTRFIKF